MKTCFTNVISHLPGVKGISQNITEPVKSWELFFNFEMINLIVVSTNIYIEKISVNFTRDAKKSNEVKV